jgi:hypothetical protein
MLRNRFRESPFPSGEMSAQNPASPLVFSVQPGKTPLCAGVRTGGLNPLYEIGGPRSAASGAEADLLAANAFCLSSLAPAPLTALDCVGAPPFDGFVPSTCD